MAFVYDEVTAAYILYDTAEVTYDGLFDGQGAWAWTQGEYP